MKNKSPQVFICECNGIPEIWPALIEAIYGVDLAEKVEVHYPLDLEELAEKASGYPPDWFLIVLNNFATEMNGRTTSLYHHGNPFIASVISSLKAAYGKPVFCISGLLRWQLEEHCLGAGADAYIDLREILSNRSISKMKKVLFRDSENDGSSMDHPV
jgi:hypothetical protein